MSYKKEMSEAVLIQILGFLCIGGLTKLVGGVLGITLGIVVGIGLIILGGRKYRIAAGKQKETLHDGEREKAVEKVALEGKPQIAKASIFALIVSIFCLIIPIFGQAVSLYVCGRALYEIKQSKGLLKGKTLAILGIVISIAYLIFLVSIFIPFHKR